MKKVKSKRFERLEKKKRKLAALANLVKLNDADRKDKSTEIVSESESSAEGEEKRQIMTASEAEPLSKKPKLEHKNRETKDNESETSNNPDEFDIKKMNLTKEQYTQLKKELKERKRQLESVPKFRLRPAGCNASLEVDQDKRTPIFLTDIQHLLMSALIGKHSPCTPERWCFLEKPYHLAHTLILVLEGVSLYHYLSNEEKFAEANNIFETKLEVVLPTATEDSIIQNLATAPLTNAQAEELIDKYGCLETAVEMINDPTLLVKSIFPVESTASTEEPVKLPEGDKFSRTKLLLSALQMVDEGYPMPLRGELASRFKGYVFTKDEYKPVSAQSPMFGVDCEMCRTTTGENELTRISIVNEKYETIYETLVMPVNKIVDYLTKYSGITAELMMAVTKRLKEVQKDVRELLPPDAILVGQSLNSDLNAMKMMHPYVIDTSVIFNMTGHRRRKSKLQALAMKFLDQMIQENVTGHDSVEDSLASIRLVQLKLKHNLDFGDEILTQKKRANEIIRLATGGTIRNNLFGQASQRDKRTAIVKNGPLHPEIKEICNKSDPAVNLKSIVCYEVESNKEAVKTTRGIALEHSLTITNLVVQAEQFQLDKIDKTVLKIDKWIGKLWKSVAHNGMFVVLLGGSVDCPSGLLKVAIKNNSAHRETAKSVDE